MLQTVHTQSSFRQSIPITELIVHEYHEKSGHEGSEHVLAALRTTFWILRARCRIKEVVNKCMLCRKRRAVPCVQKMADLPRERISNGHPAFFYVGIDYFGPFDVHVRRSTEKRYGCVFSCMSSRAVHIEIATSLNTSSFINVLRRFIARRGKPAKVFTDNGTNFVGASESCVKLWHRETASRPSHFSCRRTLSGASIHLRRPTWEACGSE
jgi:hypothetical protein